MWLISRLCIEINDIVVYFQVMERVVCGSFPGYVEIVRYIYIGYVYVELTVVSNLHTLFFVNTLQ